MHSVFTGQVTIVRVLNIRSGDNHSLLRLVLAVHSTEAARDERDDEDEEPQHAQTHCQHDAVIPRLLHGLTRNHHCDGLLSSRYWK